MKLGRKELIGGSIIAFIGVVFLGLFVHFYHEQVYYQVIFDSKGGTEVAGQNVLIGNIIKTPSQTVKEGYKFLGWFLNNKKFDFKTKIRNDITLKAKWEKIKKEEEKKDTETEIKEEKKEETKNNSNQTNNKKPEIITPKKETPVIVDVSSVTMNTGSLSLKQGGSATLSAYVLPENATDKTIAWTSSNNSVATVNNGTVTAIGAGTAIITATTSGGKSASCTVTVTKPITYNYEIIDVPNSTVEQCDIFIKNSDGVRVSGTITIHYTNDRDETVSVTTSGVRRVKSLIASISIVNAG